MAKSKREINKAYKQSLADRKLVIAKNVIPENKVKEFAGIASIMRAEHEEKQKGVTDDNAL